jgi:hypothetical protein
MTKDKGKRKKEKGKRKKEKGKRKKEKGKRKNERGKRKKEKLPSCVCLDSLVRMTMDRSWRCKS